MVLYFKDWSTRKEHPLCHPARRVYAPRAGAYYPAPHGHVGISVATPSSRLAAAQTRTHAGARGPQRMGCAWSLT